MSEASHRRAQAFLAIADQFKLGDLITESSHPVTANLSNVAKDDVPQALRLLFHVDDDVMAKYRVFVDSRRAFGMADAVLSALRGGGKLFFTGCGSTGRLSIQIVSIWRDFWRSQGSRHPEAARYEDRAFSVMAGGDFALIKSVEGFEDYAQFGRKQIADLGVSPGDVTFAITEGGETSFVIGTAWEALDKGAKVYFVYNNPDDVLCRTVERSRQVIEEPRIEKVNLTTGPMGITGSTRMQATTIEQAVVLTVLEVVARTLMREVDPASPNPQTAPEEILAGLAQVHANLLSDDVVLPLAELVRMEEGAYRSGHKCNYLADQFGIDVLTDTTERSPTYCTPPFRKFDDDKASDSWAYLFTPYAATPEAWNAVLKREPKCVEWSEADVRAMLEGEAAERSAAIVKLIGRKELMRFKVGEDGMAYRPLGPGDCTVAVGSSSRDGAFLANKARDYAVQAKSNGVKTGAIVVEAGFSATVFPADSVVHLPAPKTVDLLGAPIRAGLKMLLNALSTCTMVRLGRVMGNTMVWVVPSNLKLIDRSTRYIQRLAGLGYEDACYLLHEVMEYVAPRMAADQAYPPVVGVAVLRARHNLTNEQAEQQLKAELAVD